MMIWILLMNGMMKLSKVTPLQVKTINIMLREIKKYKNEYGHEPTSEELSKILNVPKEEIIKLQTFYKESEEEYQKLTEEIKPFSVSSLSSDEYNELVSLIHKNKHVLNETERDILLYSFGLVDGKLWTNQELALKFNKTEERIRQILAKGIRKVRHPERVHKLSDYL